MAARVDLELGQELGVSAVVVQTAAAEHLREPEHVTWTTVAGGQRRKEYTEAGRALLRSLLVPPAEKAAEKGAISLPGRGFTIWLKKAPEEAGPPVADFHALMKCCAASEPQGDVMLLIIRMCPNPTFVTVKTPDGKTAAVRVRHSRLLNPGKALRCRQLDDGSWECADRLVSPNPAYRS